MHCATKIRKYGEKISIKQLPARLPASHKMFTKIDQLTKRIRQKHRRTDWQRTAEYVSETYHSCGKTGSIKKQDGSNQNFATLDAVNLSKENRPAIS